ncbi:LAMI_0D03004g1_1 [Lachancea mirantina]|uniref:LAMI_0D03004g1_1 n=1 Tax=Lachancea mirantina TaxID=1230905 RepID=A0A1G4J9H3_9SACH|nr:LAMI_0D03004g1_1 [Lachancea mirantina]
MPIDDNNAGDESKKELLERLKHQDLNLSWLTRPGGVSNVKPEEDEDRKEERAKSRDGLVKGARRGERRMSDVGAKSQRLDDTSSDARALQVSSARRKDVKNEGSPEDRTSVVIGPNRVLRERRSSVSAGNQGRDWQVVHENPLDPEISLRRTKSLSMNSNGHIEEPKKEKRGFFRSLFGRKKKDENTSENAENMRKPQSNSQSSVSSKRRNSISSAKPSVSAERLSSVPEGVQAPALDESSRDASCDASRDTGIPLTRSKTAPTGNGSWDPRLKEFLDECKKEISSTGSRPTGTAIPPTLGKRRRFSDNFRGRPNFSIDDSLERPASVRSSRVDFKGRPIPAHPAKSQFPSALKHKPRRSASNSLSKHPTAPSPTTTNKFGAFLKKVTSHVEDHSFISDSSSDESSDESSAETELSVKEGEIPGLENIKPLKRVAFATNTYFNDPPQQICSRFPRKGEVEVKSDGSVIIHRLTPEERREILQNTSAGIVVGGSGHLKLITDDSSGEDDAKRAEEKIPPGHIRSSDLDSSNESSAQRRQIGLAAAEAAAEARAMERPADAGKVDGATEEDVQVSTSASKVTIDKPMVSRRSNVSLASVVTDESETPDERLPPEHPLIPHDVVYTRCCHLREILPIPATLKQLKKGSTDPIPLLQLRNPKPSLVEVLSFSDFLSISPVLCLSLDGVNLSTEMLRVILSSLMFKENFEKLSLRNTPLDDEGWKILCFYISRCRSLLSLDLTMVPGITVNVQRPSKSSQKSKVIRMECDMNDRSSMNWDLLSAAIVSKGGLEEVILSGAKMSLLEFVNFVEVACIKTERLGLAYNDLSQEQCSVMASWLVNSKVTGIDVGFNDLRGKLQAFSNAVMNKIKHTKNVFKYISFNSTNLEVPEGANPGNNEVLNLLNVLCYCENLKFVDFSNNPNMFPGVLNTLTDCLPVFVNLMRLHLDDNNLSSTSVVTLAEVLPMCKKLNYVSMKGTKLDFAASRALAAAVRKSNSIITVDINEENVPDKIKEKISIYSMRNMEAEIQRVNNPQVNKVSNDLSCLQDELAELLTDKPSTTEELDEGVRKFLLRLDKARGLIKRLTEDLFELRVNGQLSREGKETLIRFCFFDATFERGLELLAKRYNNKIPALNKYTNLGSSSDIIDGEDEKNTHLANNDGIHRTASAATLSSMHFKKTGHSALLPFHQPSLETQDPAEDAIEIKDDVSKAGQAADSQLREEGTVLRNTHDLMQQLSRKGDEGENMDLPQHLKDAAAAYDGGVIKDFILSHDITSVVSVLENLQKEGVELEDFFKKSNKASESSVDSKALSPSANSIVGVQANLMDSRGRAAESSDSETDSDVSSKHEEHAIDRAYDQILDNIERVRTNNNS